MSQWYYAHDGQQKGPVPISELQRLAGEGDFDPEKDLVWQEGLPDWKPASMIPELASLTQPVETPTEPTAESPPSPSPYESPTAAPSPTPAATAAPQPGAAPNTGLAIGSMVCGIVGLLTCFLWCLSIPLAIAAIVLGHMAISKIRRDPATYAGKGLAKAGLITGYLGVLLSIVYTACVLYIATRTPEQLEQMDWLPAEFSEQLQREMERQRELQGQ